MKNLDKFGLMDVIIYLLLIMFTMSILGAFIHLFWISFAPSHIATKGGLYLLPPRELTVDNYRKVLTSSFIWIGYKNTLFRTVVGTVTQLFMTALGAYALSKKFFPHRTFWTIYIVFTMFFSGGLIPSYLLVKNLKLIDTYAVMIIPGLIGSFNLIIMRNYFMSLPEELEESCLMDGAGRFRVFFSIILPISKPILMTVALWLAVGHWNSWFDVLIYIMDDKKFTLQIILRRIILTGTQQMIDMTSAGSIFQEETQSSPDGLKAAAIFVATIPIICTYPFVQKYFIKGIMVGSLKG